MIGCNLHFLTFFIVFLSSFFSLLLSLHSSFLFFLTKDVQLLEVQVCFKIIQMRYLLLLAFSNGCCNRQHHKQIRKGCDDSS